MVFGSLTVIKAERSFKGKEMKVLVPDDDHSYRVAHVRLKKVVYNHQSRCSV